MALAKTSDNPDDDLRRNALAGIQVLDQVGASGLVEVGLARDDVDNVLELLAIKAILVCIVANWVDNSADLVLAVLRSGLGGFGAKGISGNPRAGVAQNNATDLQSGPQWHGSRRYSCLGA